MDEQIGITAEKRRRQAVNRHLDEAIRVGLLDLDQKSFDLASGIANDAFATPQVDPVGIDQVRFEQLGLGQSERSGFRSRLGGAGPSGGLYPVFLLIRPVAALWQQHGRTGQTEEWPHRTFPAARVRSRKGRLTRSGSAARARRGPLAIAHPDGRSGPRIASSD